MANLLVDTDIFIDHLRGARRLEVGDNTISYSVVTRCELFAGSHDDETALRILLAPFTELAVDRAIAEQAGRLRRMSGTRIADALIAATALQFHLTLMTRNTRDFDRIPGVVLIFPGSGEE